MGQVRGTGSEILLLHVKFGGETSKQPITNKLNQQPITDNQQPISSKQLTTNNQQLTTNNQQPATNNQQPTTK
jgi:hypothetical protein